MKCFKCKGDFLVTTMVNEGAKLGYQCYKCYCGSEKSVPIRKPQPQVSVATSEGATKVVKQKKKKVKVKKVL